MTKTTSSLPLSLRLGVAVFLALSAYVVVETTRAIVLGTPAERAIAVALTEETAHDRETIRCMAREIAAADSLARMQRPGPMPDMDAVRATARTHAYESCAG